MNASRIGLVFASLLLAGLFSEAAYAACPCAGTVIPGSDPPVEYCAEGSNTPKGPNGCTVEPGGLVGTDGTGCYEIHTEDPPAGDCEACIGGTLTGGVNDLPVQGCACAGDVCISTSGKVDPNLGTLIVEVGEAACVANATSGCGGPAYP